MLEFEQTTNDPVESTGVQVESESVIVDTENTVVETPQESVAQTPAEQMPSTDPGTVTRLQQQIAKQNTLLISLGIDPESDIADRFRAGIIDKTSLLAHIGMPSQQQTPQQSNQPNPIEKLKVLKAKGQKGEATQEDFADALDVIESIASGFEQRSQASQMEQLATQCKSATLSVLEQDPVYQSLPPEVKAVEAELFLLHTDAVVGREAKGDQRYFTPSAYNYYAKQTYANLDKLRKHYMDQGKRQQMQAITPKTQTPNPISSASGAAPIPPAKAKVNQHNWKQAAAAYLRNQAQV